VYARRALVALSAFGTIATLLAPVGPVAAAVGPDVLTAGSHVTCQHGKTWIVRGKGGKKYVIRNSAWATRQCISNNGGHASFTVTRSRPQEYWAGFPNIYYGCERSVCSPGTVLPERVRQLGTVTSSWHTIAPRRGRWNVAYDFWFSKYRSTSQAHPATELMIWLDSRDLYSVRGAPTTKIGRQRYHVLSWWTGHNGVSWRYVQFRRLWMGTVATNLNLTQFFKAAEKQHFISRRDYLDAIEAGYETCTRGAGLQTKSFSVSIHSRSRHRAR
jgi:Glycosyl hydrolase family 12